MDLQEARNVFEEIRSSLPSLKIEPYPQNLNVEVGILIPVQNGLHFPIQLYLTADELHMTAGNGFWLEWFPATDAKVIEDYRVAAVGLLSGQYRILEYLRGHRLVKAQLQRPSGIKWRTVGTWFGTSWWVPWGSRARNVLQVTS